MIKLFTFEIGEIKGMQYQLVVSIDGTEILIQRILSPKYNVGPYEEVTIPIIYALPFFKKLLKYLKAYGLQ